MYTLTVENGRVTISVPICRRTFVSKGRIVVQAAVREPIPVATLNANPVLQAIARAMAWVKMLDSGTDLSFTHMAERLKIDRANMGRELRLATLSPRIIAAIINGTAPKGISVSKLVKVKSDIWAEQEREIGLVAAG